jgi:hypothetical protein
MSRAAGLVKKKPFEAFDKTMSKNHDRASGRGYDPTTRKVDAKNANQRKDLLEDAMILLQNTVDDKVSGMQFQTKLDLVGNYLHELEKYASSLKDAMTAIQENHPAPPEGSDEPLQALTVLSEVLIEGAARSKEYLAELKAFANDLQVIRDNIYTQMQLIHTEL